VLRIAFVLPELSARPIGGAAAVYRYADELVARGHHVTVVHPRESLLASLRDRLDRDMQLFDAPAAGTPGLADPPDAGRHPWYQFRAGVQDLVVRSLAEEWIPGSFDVTIATNYVTLPWIRQYPPRLGRKVYFLLDYESYMIGDGAEQAGRRRAIMTGWPIIASSPAVRELAESAGHHDVYLVPHAIDTATFCCSVPVGSSQRTLIGFPARSELTKRTRDALRAVDLVRDRIPPGTGFWCFGYERIRGLPRWVAQYAGLVNSELCALYNRSAVFVVASEWEGFGRPGAEAMACGAALVSTRNGGVSAYAADRVNALLCSPLAPGELASAIVELMTDQRLRHSVAENGVASIKGRTWGSAVANLERTLMTIIA
jgi:glycosyltransferase involved in cell wall biosynthesis